MSVPESLPSIAGTAEFAVEVGWTEDDQLGRAATDLQTRYRYLNMYLEELPEPPEFGDLGAPPRPNVTLDVLYDAERYAAAGSPGSLADLEFLLNGSENPDFPIGLLQISHSGEATTPMIEAIDQLMLSLRMVGIIDSVIPAVERVPADTDIPAIIPARSPKAVLASLSPSQFNTALERWRQLPETETVMREGIHAGIAARIDNLAEALQFNKSSLQHLIRFEYIERGNAIMFNALAGLHDSLALIEEGMGILNQVGDILNQKDPERAMVDLQALVALNRNQPQYGVDLESGKGLPDRDPGSFAAAIDNWEKAQFDRELGVTVSDLGDDSRGFIQNINTRFGFEGKKQAGRDTAINLTDQVSNHYQGTLTHLPPFLGSVEIFVDSEFEKEVFTDADGDGILTSNFGGTGRINYRTGDWEVDFFAAPRVPGKEVVAEYQYPRPVLEQDLRADPPLGDGSNTTFSGTLEITPPLLGRFKLTDGREVIRDDGILGAGNTGKLLDSLGNEVGSINYETGEWTATFPLAPLEGAEVLYEYQHHFFPVTNFLIGLGDHLTFEYPIPIPDPPDPEVDYFSQTVHPVPIRPGTVEVNAVNTQGEPVVLTDKDFGVDPGDPNIGLLVADDGSTGTINYKTGEIHVTFIDPPGYRTDISVSYLESPTLPTTNLDPEALPVSAVIGTTTGDQVQFGTLPSPLLPGSLSLTLTDGLGTNIVLEEIGDGFLSASNSQRGEYYPYHFTGVITDTWDGDPPTPAPSLIYSGVTSTDPLVESTSLPAVPINPDVDIIFRVHDTEITIPPPQPLDPLDPLSPLEIQDPTAMPLVSFDYYDNPQDSPIVGTLNLYTGEWTIEYLQTTPGTIDNPPPSDVPINVEFASQDGSQLVAHVNYHTGEFDIDWGKFPPLAGLDIRADYDPPSIVNKSEDLRAGVDPLNPNYFSGTVDAPSGVQRGTFEVQIGDFIIRDDGTGHLVSVQRRRVDNEITGESDGTRLVSGRVSNYPVNPFFNVRIGSLPTGSSNPDTQDIGLPGTTFKTKFDGDDDLEAGEINQRTGEWYLLFDDPVEAGDRDRTDYQTFDPLPTIGKINYETGEWELNLDLSEETLNYNLQLEEGIVTAHLLDVLTPVILGGAGGPPGGGPPIPDSNYERLLLALSDPAVDPTEVFFGSLALPDGTPLYTITETQVPDPADPDPLNPTLPLVTVRSAALNPDIPVTVNFKTDVAGTPPVTLGTIVNVDDVTNITEYSGIVSSFPIDPGSFDIRVGDVILFDRRNGRITGRESLSFENEILFTTNDESKVHTGQLTGAPIKPGTILIKGLEGPDLIDDGDGNIGYPLYTAGGLVPGEIDPEGTLIGTIDYQTGDWILIEDTAFETDDRNAVFSWDTVDTSLMEGTINYLTGEWTLRIDQSALPPDGTLIDVNYDLHDGIPDAGDMLLAVMGAKVTEFIRKLEEAGATGDLLDKMRAIEKDLLGESFVPDLDNPEFNLETFIRDFRDDAKGEYQRNLDRAIVAAQSLNDSEKEELRRRFFEFEEFYKSASAIMAKISQILEKIAQGIGR